MLQLLNNVLYLSHKAILIMKTSNKKHTSGRPWTAKHYSEGHQGDHFRIGTEYNWVCNIFNERDCDEANALLIAAAPDLLEALETAVKHIENIQKIYKPEQPFATGRYKAAIAKAKGGKL